jgi:hypothetical protein
MHPIFPMVRRGFGASWIFGVGRDYGEGDGRVGDCGMGGWGGWMDGWVKG